MSISSENRWLLLALLTAFAGKLALVLWGLDRGFEIGDEGLFLLLLNHPQQASPLLEVYRLLSLLEHPIRFGVVDGRILRVGAELIAATVLGAGVWGWWRRSVLGPPSIGPVHVVLFGLLGVFLSAGSRGLSYNDITTLCTSVAAGLFLVLASLPHDRVVARIALAIGVGAAVGLQLLVKFPPAVLLAGLITAYAIAFVRDRRVLGAFWLSLAIACGLPISLMYDWQGVRARLAEIAANTDTLDHGIVQVLSNYWYFDIASHRSMLLLSASFAISLAGLDWLRRRWPRLSADTALAASVAVGAVVLWRSAVANHPFNVAPSLIFFFCFLPLMAVALTWVWWRGQRGVKAQGGQTTAALCGIGLLAGLPYIDVVGTNVALTLKLSTHAPPLFLAVAIAGQSLRQRGYRWCFRLLTVILVGVSSAIAVHHQLYWPFGVATPLPDQNVPVEKLSGLKVDAATARFLDELTQAAARAGLRSGDPLLALEYMPGLVYYLDATSPASLAYYPTTWRFTCSMLESPGFPASAFLLVGRPLSGNRDNCLNAWKSADQFELVARLANPYRKVYPYFFALPDNPFLYFYAPRR